MNDLPAPLRSPAPAWAGGAAYLLAVTLLFGGAPRASGTVHGLGALLAAILLVGLVRRNPPAALALALLGSTAVVAARPNAEPTGLPGAAYQGQFLAYLAADAVLGFTVATRGRRVAAVATAASCSVQLLVIGVFAHGDNLTVNLLISVLATVAAAIAGLLGRERREHAVALRAQEVAKAVSAERLRIARELHDLVAHSIGVIAIQAGVGARIITTRPDDAAEALRTIETTSRETLAGLRRTLVSLRRADDDPSLSPTPGLADLERLAAATGDAGVRVELRRTGERRPLPAEVDLSAYRIVQEALTNVVRHAGTGRCRVTVDHGDTELRVEIVDDGRGAAGGEGAGFGLIGMRERAALLGGRLSAGPRPEGGFRVTAHLPLPVRTAVEAR